MKAPVIAFVHKKDREDAFKKAFFYLDKEKKERESIAYLPVWGQSMRMGAYDLAKVYAKMEYKTLLVDLAGRCSGSGWRIQPLSGRSSKGGCCEGICAGGWRVCDHPQCLSRERKRADGIEDTCHVPCKERGGIRPA